ncbi:hypothetical protein ACSS6W_001266 [Trichoderma asperelloides]
MSRGPRHSLSSGSANTIYDSAGESSLQSFPLSLSAAPSRQPTIIAAIVAGLLLTLTTAARAYSKRLVHRLKVIAAGLIAGQWTSGDCESRADFELERSHASPIVNYPTTASHYSQNCLSMSTWPPGAERFDPALATFLFHPSLEKASLMVSPMLAIPATATVTGEHNAPRLTASLRGERINKLSTPSFSGTNL